MHHPFLLQVLHNRDQLCSILPHKVLVQFVYADEIDKRRLTFLRDQVKQGSIGAVLKNEVQVIIILRYSKKITLTIMVVMSLMINGC